MAFMKNKFPFFVAEISANHLGKVELAHRLIEQASRAGADAIKLQTYTADTMTLDNDNFYVSKDHELWSNKNLYQLYKEAYTPWEWHEELFNHAQELNLMAFSSPFDFSAVDFLESLSCPIYKIASLETWDLNLISYAAQTMKPIIMSTGASELSEIREAVEAALETGNPNISLLVCTSSYPAIPAESHLKRITTLSKEFNLRIGISDHTLGIGVSVAAIALGATIVEKHLTFDRIEGGHDAAFSMQPEEFKNLVTEGRTAYQALGNSEWKIQDSERESRRLRRSLYVVKDVKKGDLATSENIRAIRPNGGTPPKILKSMLGKKFLIDVAAGTPANLNQVG